MPVNTEEQSKFRCYLSGPISGISEAKASEWREKAVELAEPHLIMVNPVEWEDEYIKDPVMGMRRDIAEMFHSSILVVNFTHAPDPAILRGTTAELASWGAWQVIEQQLGSPIHGPSIGIFRDKEQEEALHPWLTEYVWKTFYNLEKAIQWLNLESSTWTTEGLAVKPPEPVTEIETEPDTEPKLEIARH